MDIDSEIAPLVEKMNAALGPIQTELIPLFASLDEDTVMSSYSLHEQARLHLSAAFALAFGLYALDKLNHYQPPATNKVEATHNRTVVTGGSAVDAQLVLKIERITDYIRKLREITNAEGQVQAAAAAAAATAAVARLPATESTASTSATTTTATATAAVAPAAGGKSPKKRARYAEPTQDMAEEEADDLGDAAMFKVVSRVPGEASALVGRLLQQQTEGVAPENKRRRKQ